MFLDPRAAHRRHRRLGDQLLGGRRHRSAAGRHPAAVLLVGLGVFLLGVPVMVLAAGGGADSAAGVPRSRRRAGWICSAPGLSLAAVLLMIYGLKRIAEGGLAGCPQRPSSDRPGGGHPVRAPAANAGRSPHRPAPLPRGHLQRVPGHLHGSDALSPSAPTSSSRSISSSCSGLSPLQRGLWTLPSMRRLRRRLHAGAAHRAPHPPAPYDGRPACSSPPPGSASHPGGYGHRASRPSSWAPSSTPSASPAIVLADRSGGRQRSRRAGRGRLRHLGDQLRAGWGARHRHPRQHRHRRLSPRHDRPRSRPASRPTRRRPRGRLWAAPWRRRSGCPARSAPSCSGPPARPSPRGSSSRPR